MTSTAPSIQIEHLFATTLIVDVPPISRAPILAALSTAAGSAIRRPGEAWVDHRLADGVAEARTLLEHARSIASRMTANAGEVAGTPSWRSRLSSCVVAAGDTVEFAPFYDAYWSGLYIVDDGYDGKPERHFGGEIVFNDPRLPATMMEVPDLRLRVHLGGTLAPYEPEVVVRPESGQLLLCPGWLRVAHRPFRGPSQRVMLRLSLTALL